MFAPGHTPSVVICYSTPFPEMQGNIVHVDYELSSWKHDGDDLGKAAAEPTEGIKIVKHTGYVIFDDFISHKGGGSAQGGERQPHPDKPDDARFLGKPGEIKETITQGGNRYLTKIGDEGKAGWERHYTTHGNSKHHVDPHDHIVDWSTGIPKLISSPDLEGVFKYYERRKAAMGENIDLRQYPEDILNFQTISDFKWSMMRGGEVQFIYQGKSYYAFPLDSGFLIGEGFEFADGRPINPGDHQFVEDTDGTHYNTIDTLLDHMIAGKKLREIIKQVLVTERTI